MLKNTAVNFFGSQAALAKTLKISRTAVSKWELIIPEKQAGRLDRLTDGVLSFEEAHYQTDQTVQPIEAA